MRGLAAALVATIALLAVAGSLLGAEKDEAIEQSLIEAKQAYAKAIADLDAALLERIDAKIRETAETGDLNAVKALMAARDRFAESHVVPEAEPLKHAVGVYGDSLHAIRAKLIAAYDEAIAGYTKALNIDRATEIQTEKKGFEAGRHEVQAPLPAITLPNAKLDHEYQQALELHARAHEHARHEVLSTFDQRISFYESRSDADQVAQLKQAREAFEASQHFMHVQDPAIRRIEQRYASITDGANTRLERVYHALIVRLERAGETDLAEQLKARMAQTLTGQGGRAAPPAFDPAKLARVPDRLFGADQTYTSFDPQGGLLVGVRVSYKQAFGGNLIESIQPLFRRPSGEIVAGDRYGGRTGRPIEVIAKKGYAVGEIHGRIGAMINGMKLIFHRDLGDRLDPADAYASDWLGHTEGGGPFTHKSEGKLVYGLFGKPRDDWAGQFGLLVAPDAASK